MAETEKRQDTSAHLSENRWEGPLEEGSLLHLDRAAPLIPLLCPSAEELLSLLGQGLRLPLLAQEDQALESSDLAAVTLLEQSNLTDALETLARESGESARLQGWSGLCLAEGRLISSDGISAPLLLWPVTLEESSEGGWLLARGSEGSLRNEAVLSLLPAPEEGWSPNREPLARQLDQLLEAQPDWQRKEGLWLGRFPLWSLELRHTLACPAVPDSAAVLLEQAPGDAPVLDCSDTQGEEGILAPLPLDGVQMTAINHLMQGESLLVSGGKGTGKTQLAAGLMSNAMGVGQRVLLVSNWESDRIAVRERMELLGLSDLVLELPSLGDRKNAVLHQYNVAAQVHPETSAEGYFSLSEQTAQLARRLDRSAAALHTPDKCGFSPFQLICRYLQEAAPVDALLPLPQPMLSHLDAQGLENRLDCAQQLAQSAQALGQVAGHPLSLVWGCEYPEGLAEALPPVLDDLLEAIHQLDAVGAQWCGRTGLEPPRSQEDWQGLRDGAHLLAEWQNYPASWASSPRIPLLLETVQELRRHFDQAQRLQARIREKWEDAVFALDGVKLEKQWRFLKEGWTLPTEPDRERTLRQLLTQAESLLAGLETVGRQWARCVHIPVPTTRDSWERSYEVAVELARWKEIPGEWGSCSSLQALLWDVGELIDHGKQAKECKEVLLRDWLPDFLTLDGQALMERWQKEGGNWGIGWLKRQSPLRSELEGYCQCRLTTDLLENSLRWLLDYQSELAQCDEIYHRWEPELKSVYKREDTVWLWLETARTVAAESHDWLTELTGSEDFLRQYGSSPEAVAAAGQLQEQWELARDTLGHLDVMIGRTGQPDSRNWLSERRSDCRRLRNLLQIRKQLEENAKGPLVLGEIGDALSLLAQHQKERAAVAALYDRWEAELEGLYLGSDTDWDALYTLSLQAVNSDDALSELTGDLELRARLAGDPQAQADAQALCETYQAVCDQAGRLSKLASAHLTSGSGLWLEQLRQSCEILRSHLDQLEAWMNWRSQCRRGESLGLHSFVAHFDRPLEPEEDTLSLFRKSLYRAILQLELDWTPELRQFSARQLGEILRQYARLDETLTQRTREELLHVAACRLPDLVREPLLREEVSLLRWANETCGRDISLEGLIHGLPRMTKGFFPCVLASPADALRCFGADCAFDYIIVDGAERIPAPVGKALLNLGKTALLLSGGRRMEPTVLPEGLSLWAVCQSLPLSRLWLRRCYLPRPESLLWLEHLTDRLSGYPTCRPESFAIRTQPVVGRLAGETSPAEAAAVAARAALLLEEGHTSLAIAALTASQARLIRSLLRQAAQENPAQADALNRLPVLQPWELGSRSWETLLFSLTLAPDQGEGLSGALALIGQWDGVSPLTDTLAAAEKQLWLFTSLDRQDWPVLAKAQPQLVDFLRFAQDEALREPVRPLPYTNRVQEELCLALRERGCLAEPGPAPVSVRIASGQSGGGYLLGVLLDDQDYGAIPRTRERELTQTQLLQAQGWNLCRVWTMDWLQNRERVIELLLKMLEHIENSPDEEAPAPVPAPAEEPLPLYAPAQLTVMGIRDNEVSNPSFQNRIYRVVEQIILQESPLSVNQLTCRMLTAFGLDAQDEELQRHCASLWRKLGLRITREGDLNYVWRTDCDPDEYRQFRVSGSGAHFRAPEDVSCQESANAACAVLAREIALIPADLAREAAVLLGYSPAQPEAIACGQRGVQYALLMGRMLETPIGTVVLNPHEK